MKVLEHLHFDVFNVKHRFFLVLTLEMNKVGSCFTVPETSVLVESNSCIPACITWGITQGSGESILLG